MAKKMLHIDRFLQKLDKTGNQEFPECWIWTGAKTSKNYGSFKYYEDKPAIGAHVSSYLFYVGEIADGMYVCHRCDNPLCVNPDHLFLGSNSDNMKDMVKKNRSGWSNRERTHCRRGHDFSVVGVKISTKANGKSFRTCKECSRMNDAKRSNASVAQSDRATDF
jgi:hypothetical protein